MDNLLAFEGRMRRKDYWLSAVITPIVAVILIVLIAGVAQVLSKVLAILIAVVLMIMLIVHEVAENTKRCHDLGLSGWFQLIPLFGLVLLFKSGDIGPNKFGPDPKQTNFKSDDDLNFHRPRSRFEEELAQIKQERKSVT